MLATRLQRHRETEGPTERLLTLSVFPAQFSVDVFDDPWQLLLLPLARCFIWNRHVEQLLVVFRLPCLDIVPEVHSTAPPMLPPPVASPFPSCKPTGEPVHRPTTRELIGWLLQTCFRTDSPLSNHRPGSVAVCVMERLGAPCKPHNSWSYPST